MGAMERLDKLIELQKSGNEDYVIEFLKFCENDEKNEPKQVISALEKVDNKSLTQDDVYWKLIDKRLAKNGIRI